jgi:hypothetical protein
MQEVILLQPLASSLPILVFLIATQNAKATKATIRVYSTKLWPSSSINKRFKSSMSFQLLSPGEVACSSKRRDGLDKQSSQVRSGGPRAPTKFFASVKIAAAEGVPGFVSIVFRISSSTPSAKRRLNESSRPLRIPYGFCLYDPLSDKTNSQIF